MTESEVQRAIMRICKVDGHDSDFNVVGFYALCDRLKQIGIAEEREACAKVCDDQHDKARTSTGAARANAAAAAIRARGQA